LDEKNGGPLSVLHVSKRGIFRLGFQNLGETLLGVLLAHPAGRARAPISRFRARMSRPGRSFRARYVA